MSTSNPMMVNLIEQHKAQRQNLTPVESSIPRQAVLTDHNGNVLLWEDVPYYRGRGRGKGKRTNI